MVYQDRVFIDISFWPLWFDLNGHMAMYFNNTALWCNWGNPTKGNTRNNLQKNIFSGLGTIRSNLGNPTLKYKVRTRGSNTANGYTNEWLSRNKFNELFGGKPSQKAAKRHTYSTNNREINNILIEFNCRRTVINTISLVVVERTKHKH